MAAPDTSSYLLLSGDPALANSRTLLGASGILVSPGAPGGTATVGITGQMAGLVTANTVGLLNRYSNGTMGVSAFGSSPSVVFSGGTVAGVPWVANVQPSSSIQNIEIAVSGSVEGTSSRISFNPGSNISITATPGDGQMDVAISATGGSGGAPADLTYVTVDDETVDLPNSQTWESLWAAKLPITPASGGIGLTGFAGPGSLLVAADTTTLVDLNAPIGAGFFLSALDDGFGNYIPTWVSGTGSGTVTSVALTSPNSNAILSGTNPITTSGTIDINIGTPIYYNALNLSIGPTPMPNFGIWGGNIYIGPTGSPAALTTGMNNNIFMGINAGVSGQVLTNSIGIGTSSQEAAIDTAFNTSLGVSSLSSITTAAGNNNNNTAIGYAAMLTGNGDVKNSVAVGYFALGTATTTIDQTVAIGSQAANVGAGSTYSYSVLVGTRTGLQAGVYTAMTMVGHEASVDVPTGKIYCTAIGASSTVRDQYQVQIGFNASACLDQYFMPGTGPAVPTEPQAAFWLDGNNHKLMKLVGDVDSRTGALYLAKQNYTMGTTTVTAGIDVVVTVNSGAMATGLIPVILLTVRPVDETMTLAGITWNQPGTENYTTTSFDIRVPGVLSADINVNWVIINYS